MEADAFSALRSIIKKNRPSRVRNAQPKVANALDSLFLFDLDTIKQKKDNCVIGLCDVSAI